MWAWKGFRGEVVGMSDVRNVDGCQQHQAARGDLLQPCAASLGGVLKGVGPTESKTWLWVAAEHFASHDARCLGHPIESWRLLQGRQSF